MMNPAGISFGTEPKKGRQKVARPSEVLFLERVDNWLNGELYLSRPTDSISQHHNSIHLFLGVLR